MIFRRLFLGWQRTPGPCSTVLGKQASTEPHPQSLLVSESGISSAVTFITRMKKGFKIYLDLPERQRKGWVFPWET